MKNNVIKLAALFVMCGTAAFAQTDKNPVKAEYEGNVFKPAKREATAENVARLQLPAGFSVQKFAQNLGKPRMLAVGTDGTVYMTRREEGDVMMLRDNNGDGMADEQKSVAKKEQMHGITIHNGKMYLVTVKEVFSADIKKDGTLGSLKMLIDDLPDGGQHPNRTIAFGPDGKMYITVGSTCNACDETNKEAATILIADANGKNRRIFAKGLRNTIGFDWHPDSRELWGMDHGIDWLGDEEQREELNKLTEGSDYGWPYIYEDGKHNVTDEPPHGMTHEQYAAKTKFPELTYQAHSSPLGLVFYDGAQFPAEYRGNAFVTFRGSWNRSTPSGYKVARLRFENGRPAAFEDFLTGFLIEENKAQFGRVTGIAIHTDGSLLVADDSGGVIYRISYKK